MLSEKHLYALLAVDGLSGLPAQANETAGPAEPPVCGMKPACGHHRAWAAHFST